MWKIIDIVLDELAHKNDYNYFLHFILEQSRIKSLDDHYFTCAKVCYSTHITQTEIDNMEFWEYTNFVIYLTKIIEEENKQSTNAQKGSQPDSQKSYRDMMRSSQSKLSRNMSNFKSPKI